MKRMASCFVTLALLMLLGVGIAQADFGGAWFTLAPMPSTRQEVSTAVLNGRIFVIGGFDTEGRSTDTVEVYDPTTNTWGSAAPLPIATNHNAAAVAAGTLYSFGGTSNRVFAYDQEQDAWVEVAEIKEELSRKVNIGEHRALENRVTGLEVKL